MSCKCGSWPSTWSMSRWYARTTATKVRPAPHKEPDPSWIGLLFCALAQDGGEEALDRVGGDLAAGALQVHVAAVVGPGQSHKEMRPARRREPRVEPRALGEGDQVVALAVDQQRGRGRGADKVDGRGGLIGGRRGGGAAAEIRVEHGRRVEHGGVGRMVVAVDEVGGPIDRDRAAD